MARSEITRLVRYHTMDGHVDWLSRPDAEGKLETELELFDRWSDAGLLVGAEVIKPFIED